jgi:hypothetical protein
VNANLPPDVREKLESILNEARIEPLHLRIDLSANRATPALAAMLTNVLIARGAWVTHDKSDIPSNSFAESAVDLTGLHIHIGRMTWVRDEEATRWAGPYPQ